MILVVMCLCVALIIATVAAINVSIPKIQTNSLRPSNTPLVWIVDVYVIVFAGSCFLPERWAIGTAANGRC
jgi:hypothetical protein